MKQYYSLILLTIMVVLFFDFDFSEIAVAGRQIDEREAEGLVAYIVNTNIEKIPYPDDTKINKCDSCDGDGYMTHGDGHKTKCPCENCECKKKQNMIQVPVDPPTPLEDNIYENYYIIKWTASWCAPCKVWDNNHRKDLEDIGIQVTDIDIDVSKDLANKYKIQSVPQFWICTKSDQKMYKNFQFSNVGSTTLVDAIQKLDKQLKQE